MKTVGLIGYGFIGKYLREYLAETEDISVAFVYDRNEEVTAALPREKVLKSPEMLEAFLADNSVDLVVETAVYQAVMELAPIVLPHSDFLTFSSCAFAYEDFAQEAEVLCKTYGHRVFIPHGAVLGYDGIFDGRAALEKVIITTTKKPRNLGVDVTERTVLFEGPTREACKMYPRNVNVHAGIAVAGLGFDRTVSRIVADPDVEGNTHLIQVTADGMRFSIEVCSIPQGLVTGAYTPLSALNTVKRIVSKEPGLTIC